MQVDSFRRTGKNSIAHFTANLPVNFPLFSGSFVNVLKTSSTRSRACRFLPVIDCANCENARAKPARFPRERSCAKGDCAAARCAGITVWEAVSPLSAALRNQG